MKSHICNNKENEVDRFWGNTKTPIPSLAPPEEPMVRVIEIKDLRQTMEIETGYDETNAWVEWVKYTVRAIATPVPIVDQEPRWSPSRSGGNRIGEE